MPAATCAMVEFVLESTFTGVCVYRPAAWCADGAGVSGTHVRDCFTYGGSPAIDFGLGDCDGDGIRNQDEAAGQRCVVPPMDAGMPPSDAGPADASVPRDSAMGPAEDAGAATDSGPPAPDTGARNTDTGPTRRGGDDFPTATSAFRGTGGCTCDASGREGLGSSFGLAFLVGLALMRRRRS